MLTSKENRKLVAQIIDEAGGKVIGRTKLQKMIYLLQLSGQLNVFKFEYRHYGPYSEELAEVTREASILGLIEENELPTQWGGRYSVYTTKQVEQVIISNEERERFIKVMLDIDSIELELAATAAYLATSEKCNDPWIETAKRKPEKAADGRLDKAKQSYTLLRNMLSVKSLPDI